MLKEIEETLLKASGELDEYFANVVSELQKKPAEDGFFAFCYDPLGEPIPESRDKNGLTDYLDLVWEPVSIRSQHTENDDQIIGVLQSGELIVEEYSDGGTYQVRFESLTLIEKLDLCKRIEEFNE